MSTLLLTMALAFVIVILAVAMMAIGWMITGRSRLRPGACGRDPTKKINRDEDCGSAAQCQVCEPEIRETKNDKIR